MEHAGLLSALAFLSLASAGLGIELLLSGPSFPRGTGHVFPRLGMDRSQVRCRAGRPGFRVQWIYGRVSGLASLHGLPRLDALGVLAHAESMDARGAMDHLGGTGRHIANVI